MPCASARGSSTSGVGSRAWRLFRRRRMARNSISPRPGARRASAPFPGRTATLQLANVPFEQSRALRLSYDALGGDPVAALTPTFTPPDVTRMRTYELMATPLVYSGQQVSARVLAGGRQRKRRHGRLANPGLRAQATPCTPSMASGSICRPAEKPSFAGGCPKRAASQFNRSDLRCGRTPVRSKAPSSSTGCGGTGRLTFACVVPTNRASSGDAPG